MIPFDQDVIDQLEAGQVDYRDALTLVFDSGVISIFIGGRGQFEWSDERLGTQTFYGGGALVSLDLPESGRGPTSQAITARLLETYMVEGSDIPVNVFDDGVRATIDEEPWQGRSAIVSVFWLGAGGLPIYREQHSIREIDAMPLEWDGDGNPIRLLVLEEPDITQRDIEGKTSNGAFQALIDPTDRALEHVGSTVRQLQKINFGRVEGAA